jgi:hypothetical protein
MEDLGDSDDMTQSNQEADMKVETEKTEIIASTTDNFHGY